MNDDVTYLFNGKVDGLGRDGLDERLVFRQRTTVLQGVSTRPTDMITCHLAHCKRLTLVIEAFTLTVVAEIGDRSQFATIALSAAGNPLGVCAGATAGHFLATGTAVIAGSYLSNYLSERGILILGGVLFLIFAFTTAFGIF